jgi:hypothetical protein
MKSARQKLETLILAAVIFLSIAATACGQSFSLYSVTNKSTSNDIATNSAEPAGNETNTPLPLIPLIKFQDVPLTIALENLARQASFNFLIDPPVKYGELDSNGQILTEPLVSHQWENVSAEKVFNILCFDYRFTVVKDTWTGVSFICANGHSVHLVKIDFNPGDTNVIPIIQFEEVPISVALENLARQASINYTFNAQTNYSEQNPEPMIDVHFQNITATKAFVATCEDYDLDITTNSDTGALLIEPCH